MAHVSHVHTHKAAETLLHTKQGHAVIAAGTMIAAPILGPMVAAAAVPAALVIGVGWGIHKLCSLGK